MTVWRRPSLAVGLPSCAVLLIIVVETFILTVSVVQSFDVLELLILKHVGLSVHRLGHITFFGGLTSSVDPH